MKVKYFTLKTEKILDYHHKAFAERIDSSMSREIVTFYNTHSSLSPYWSGACLPREEFTQEVGTDEKENDGN
jgi:hypothetical protein